MGGQDVSGAEQIADATIDRLSIMTGKSSGAEQITNATVGYRGVSTMTTNGEPTRIRKMIHQGSHKLEQDTCKYAARQFTKPETSISKPQSNTAQNFDQKQRLNFPPNSKRMTREPNQRYETKDQDDTSKRPNAQRTGLADNATTSQSQNPTS